jgi:hypothetical protein
MFFGKNRKKDKEKKTRKEIQRISEEISKIWNSEEDTKRFDINGSYTGNPKNDDVPVQDADDL